MTDTDDNRGVSALQTSVSFSSEELVLVDSDDRVTGYASKSATHEGGGRLHRAFSVFLFDAQKRVLLHQRSALKPLWPGYWTNSCCSHPRRGEPLDAAVRRRLREELGVSAIPTALYWFEYRASYADLGTEHELCHVFLARADHTRIRAHDEEISDFCWLQVEEVDALMQRAPETLTPWFRLEWACLRGPQRGAMDAYLELLESPRSVA